MSDAKFQHDVALSVHHAKSTAKDDPDPSPVQGTYPWPACFECSAREGMRIAVESYGMHKEKTKSQRSCKHMLVVWAECSHGADDRDATGRPKLFTAMSTRHRQEARIEVPSWWSDGVEAAAISRLAFFARDEAPETDEVQRIK